MTGFTRAAGRHDGVGWTWEMRSVNGRGLDLRVRTPSGYDALEAVARDAAAKSLKRGSVQIALALDRAGAEAAFAVNRDFLNQLIELSTELKGNKALSPDRPRLEALLAVRGVVEPREAADDPEAVEERLAAIGRSLEEALAALVVARRAEGAKLEAILRERLDEMDGLCGEAETAATARTDAIRERLRTQIEELLGMAPALSEERLAQEVATLAVKADVREELDRLRAHIDGARVLLDEGDAIGRRLDFLCQEFNRETNTLCSKAGDIELTRIGLGLKAVVDQFREQALNVE